MLDYARPYDHANMCEMYIPSTPTAPARLETFQVFKKGNASFIYGNYYSNYDVYSETEVDAGNVYHNLVAREYPREEWRYNKTVVEWTEDDTMTWIHECAIAHGFGECDVPIYNFKVPGIELREMRKEEIIQRMTHPHVAPHSSTRLGEIVYDKLQTRLSEEMIRPTSLFRYGESDPYQHHESAQTMLDLDSLEHKNRLYTDYKPNDRDSYSLMPNCDSSDDAEDFRLSESASPECPYGSDGSKSGDEEEKRKIKRPPGRPKGSGKRISKRPRSVSVPEFLRNLLLNPKHCPSIIKWENHAEGKFRFVKPDEVAKLWGQMKQNDNMTFEKFSRAMRYHYRQSVLVSVPSHRLVYQFGHKGPDFKTDNPNFVKVKLETMTYS
ncbi:uncharacterized protein [Epargyreus clarus]|uniref:uncharacterized protein n=1 Tax=Epargyreus clarus TaxID=520877 RepID=UPI003C3066FC